MLYISKLNISINNVPHVLGVDVVYVVYLFIINKIGF